MYFCHSTCKIILYSKGFNKKTIFFSVLSDCEEEDVNYKDMLKFWKRHNVMLAKEMMPAIKQTKGIFVS